METFRQNIRVQLYLYPLFYVLQPFLFESFTSKNIERLPYAPHIYDVLVLCIAFDYKIHKFVSFWRVEKRLRFE